MNTEDGLNESMKQKLMAFVIGVMVAICFFPTMFMNVRADDNDTFLVTMYGSYLECNIVNASWDVGVVQMSKSYWTNETGETQKAETYNSTAGVNLDFEMVISSDAATWYTVWAGNYTTGPDQYKLNASDDSWTGQTALNLTTYAEVQANFDPSANVTFDLRFDAPTSTTTGEQQTVTLNGKVTVH